MFSKLEVMVKMDRNFSSPSGLQMEKQLAGPDSPHKGMDEEVENLFGGYPQYCLVSNSQVKQSDANVKQSDTNVNLKTVR
jgi:hypothetical protein